MGRRKKRPPVEASGPYIIQSEPRRWPPQSNGQELTEPAHWYYASPGWTTSQSKATAFASPSAAVKEISELRKLVPHVEFSLVPATGGLMYKPIR